MGFEMSYQAIPPNCGLIELARSDIEVGESLMSVPYWFTRSVPRPAPGREDDKKGRIGPSTLVSWSLNTQEAAKEYRSASCLRRLSEMSLRPSGR